jgi:hypothetical protein
VSACPRLIGPYSNGGYDWDDGTHGPLRFVTAEEAETLRSNYSVKPFTPLPVSTPADFKPTGTDLRRQFLAEVEKCICRDRQATYGDAEDNFADIALMASIVLRGKLREGASLDARDVAAFCACIKLARIATSPDHLDNWTDLGGYAGCGWGIVKRDALR